ncbi:MAG: N-alpha-acetyl diaminobutyric acid deacetylase DoeB, partial [Alphaproteobacteria bacterium]
PTARTGVAPIDYCANMDGILVARHFPGLVKTGDCVAVVGVTLDDA